MKDIEKRALDMKLSIQGGYVPKEFLKSYFLGELEKQRKIDTEKACEYLNSHIDMKLTIYHNDTWMSLEQFIENFKKAMEKL